MEEEKLKFVKLPNGMTMNGLKPKDVLIYLGLKRHDNKTAGCFPSLNKLKEELGTSINTIRDGIQNLVNAGYITKDKKGRGICYKFSEEKYFEPFSEEFLDDKDLTFSEKSYIAASQQYMFKNSENSGVITFTNMELSEHINMSTPTIAKYDKLLKDKNYLTIVEESTRDLTTGCNNKAKIFLLQRFGQAIAYQLRNQEKFNREISGSVESLTKRMDAFEKENSNLKKENELLKQQLAKEQSSKIKEKEDQNKITMD